MITVLADTAQREAAAAWFAALRSQICAAFEAIEDEADCVFKDRAPGRFTFKEWQRPEGGGGIMGMMKGRVFEKVGVNISTVWGDFAEEFRSRLPGTEKSSAFWASGVSLVAHLHSPLVPAAHFNTRMISTTDKIWFGGGGDLNPMYPVATDTADFHGAFKAVCDRYDPAYFPKFKKWCDEYFFIKHRGVARGEGGIFFDYHNTGDWARDFAFVREVGEAFRDIYPALIRRHLAEPWTPEQRQWQLQKRGYYAEFNLLYDRGTEFGLKTGGNVEAILMSLPPEAAWP
ncbi:MAG: oxygen-dependent coproporphyrinogen oxidase [Holosporales bacterium]